jgi:hypothetical protein
MNFPDFFAPYFMALSLGGFVALAAKISVYCLFQRSLGAGKAVLLGLAVHALSFGAGMGLGWLVLPDHGYGWNAAVAMSFLYAATVSLAVESACLFALGKKLALKWTGPTVAVANLVYYLSLAIGIAITEVLLRYDVF